MNVVKYFRENTRTFLMVFMALLLVAFLIPQQIQGCGDARAEQRFRLGDLAGSPLTNVALQSTDRDRAVLERLGFLRFEQLPPDRLHYHLLRREAAAMDVHFPRSQVKDLLREAGMTDDVVVAVAESTRASYEEIFNAISGWMAVGQVRNAQSAASFDSLARQELTYRNRNQEAVVQISQIPTQGFVHTVPEPSEEQLQAFFAETRDRFTSHTDDQLVFGYRRPDRVRVETITLNPQKLLGRVQVRASQVREFFDENASRYTKPDPMAPQQPGSPPPTLPMTFDEAAETARADLRAIRAAEEAQRIINDIQSEAARPWVGLERDDKGFVISPPAESLSFEALAARHADDGVEYAATTLMQVNELRGIPGLGQAFIGDRPPTPAAELAFRVKGLFEGQSAADRGPVLALMEPSPIALTRRSDPRLGRMRPDQPFLMRVIEIAPSAPPASIDEVRSDLVRDWKLVQAHAKAQEAAAALVERARQVGLEAAVSEATALKDTLAAAEAAATQAAGASPIPQRFVESLTPVSPSGVKRAATFVPQFGSVPGLVETAFKLGESAGDAPHRAAATPLARQFKVAVVELIEIKPIYRGAFEAQLANAAEQTSAQLRRRVDMEWREPENIHGRVGFTPLAAPTPN